MNNPSAPVVILGAGPAGLSAAWRLTAAGVPVQVIEADSQPGGLCATVERDGFRFDLGGHRIISKHSALISRIRELLGDDLLEQERCSKILLDGKQFAYPLELGDLHGKLSVATMARVLAGYSAEALRRPLRRKKAVSFEEWTVHRFGRPLYDLFFGPYTEKLWGLPPSQLSADWAAQRISLLNLADVALRLGGLRQGGSRTYARRYLYPRHGIGQLFERLVDWLEAQGTTVECDTRAVGLVLEQGRVAGVRVERDGAVTTLACSRLVSTIPLQTLSRWIDPTTATASSRLRHRGLRFLNIALEGPPLLDGTWYYVHSPNLAMTRVQEPLQRSPYMAPPGHTGAMLEIPCDPGDELWEMGDDLLFDRMASQLESLGLPVRDRALWWFSTYAPGAYPIYTLDYRANRQVLLDAVDRIENLHTIGRQGLFRYLFMDTAMEMGWQAGEDIIARRRPRSDRSMAIDHQPTLLEVQATTA